MPSTLDPAGFAQRQLEAYNAYDLERFVAEYTEAVEVFVLPDAKTVSVGKAVLAAHYRHPELHGSGAQRWSKVSEDRSA